MAAVGADSDSDPATTKTKTSMRKRRRRSVAGPAGRVAASVLAVLALADLARPALGMASPPPDALQAYRRSEGVSALSGNDEVFMVGGPCCHYMADKDGHPVVWDDVVNAYAYADAVAVVEGGGNESHGSDSGDGSDSDDGSDSRDGASRRRLASEGRVLVGSAAGARWLGASAEVADVACEASAAAQFCTGDDADDDALDAEAEAAFFHTDSDSDSDSDSEVNASVDSDSESAFENLVLLIRFSDHAASGRALPSRSAYEALFNSATATDEASGAPTGSVRSYYAAQSYGNVDLHSTVTDWLDVPFTEAEASMGCSSLCYRSRANVLHDAIVHALDGFHRDVQARGGDFGVFDRDGDGEIDALTVVHSGFGAEWGDIAGGPSTSARVWSHQWKLLRSQYYDGVKVRSYNVNTGLWGTQGARPTRIGVVCHELGHFFGLPDLYDSSAPISATFGAFGIMSGAWGADGSQLYPGSFSPFSKQKVGWLEPEELGPSGRKLLAPVQSSGEVLKVTHGFPPNEYLLVESRANSSAVAGAEWDAQLPGGIYVWHVDAGVGSDWNHFQGFPGDGGAWPRKHHHVRLIQQDNRWSLEKDQWWRWDSDDAFTSVSHVLSDRSQPSLLSYEQRYKAAADCRTTGNALSDFRFVPDGSAPSSFAYARSDSEWCEPRSPSPAPTMLPTAAPVVPTDHPTGFPTRKPTGFPSPAPTPAPTPLPTFFVGQSTGKLVKFRFCTSPERVADPELCSHGKQARKWCMWNTGAVQRRSAETGAVEVRGINEEFPVQCIPKLVNSKRVRVRFAHFRFCTFRSRVQSASKCTRGRAARNRCFWNERLDAEATAVAINDDYPVQCLPTFLQNEHPVPV